ncbi:hypothetical protein OROGR_026145 [Orobanche gracilis]
MMESIIAKFRSLDAYPKINEDFYSRTLSGGVITVASSIIMLLLFISELSSYVARLLEFFVLSHPSVMMIYLMDAFCTFSRYAYQREFEFRLYLYAVMETKLVVDTSRGERLRINVE